jgi:hypothetical protein
MTKCMLLFLFIFMCFFLIFNDKSKSNDITNTFDKIEKNNINLTIWEAIRR